MGRIKNIIRGSQKWLPFFVFMLGISVTAEDRVVPYEMSKKGRVLVPVTVGDKGEHLFMLDTASNATVIYQTGAIMLDLPSAGRKTRRVMTATGITQEPVYKLGQLTFGPIEKYINETIALSVTEDASLMGILGLDMIYGRVLEINKKEREITFHSNADSFQNHKDWQAAPMANVGGAALVLTVKIGGVELMGMVDTGATISIVNMATFVALQKAGGKFDLEIKKRRIEAAAGKISATRIYVPRMKLGKMAYNNLDLTAANLPVFKHLGMNAKPAMIIGMDILKRHSMVLDYKQKRLFLKR